MPETAISAADVKALFLSSGDFTTAQAKQAVEALSTDQTQYRALREALTELEAKGVNAAHRVRLGVGQYFLGRYHKAVDTLSSADGGLAHFYLAKALAARRDFQSANEQFQAAAKAGYPAAEAALSRAESLRSLGRSEDALKLLDGLSGAVEQTAEYLYQRGATVAALGGNPLEVVALLERAVETDPRHAGALFGLAMEHDRRGNDDTAMDLYQKSAGRFPAHLGALLNLGMLYEDRQQYERARQCYQRILDVYPDEPRARLFMKDAQASGDMYYDEDAQKRRDRLGQVLSVPVTDFELSVRSRNCLQKMGLLTLGDLTRTTEHELLSSKNFGETSLVEIKEMMNSKGLEMGQFADERQISALPEPTTVTPDEQALLNRSIADLNLSVRARKCMVRLGVTTIADLVRRTGDELLECKNFGVTSLNEVREKLTQHGMRLRGD